jgi:TRAP-type C4-dicarboxylate transport system permease small subunit
MAKLLKVIRGLDSSIAAVQRVFLFFLMSLLTGSMFTEIISRYFFGVSFFGLEDFIGYSAVWVYLIGSAYGSYERSHIKAEFIGVFVKSERKLNITRAVSASISTFMSCVFVKWSYDFCIESITMHEVTPTQSVPMIYFQSSFLVGGILMAGYFLWETIDFSFQAYRS